MDHLDAAYEELKQLAKDRRSKLEESRKLWQFYWDMADEEGWIKEKETLMSSPDLGHDLTSVQLLISKHKVCIYLSMPSSELFRVPTVMESQGKICGHGKVMENSKNIKSHGKVKILP